MSFFITSLGYDELTGTDTKLLITLWFGVKDNELYIHLNAQSKYHWLTRSIFQDTLRQNQKTGCYFLLVFTRNRK